MSEESYGLPEGATVSADAGSADPRQMVRLREAAGILDIPESTLRRHAAAGKVPARKLGRLWRVNRAWLTATTAWTGEKP